MSRDSRSTVLDGITGVVSAIVVATLAVKGVWLTIKQAAERHKSPRRVIDQAIHHGTLPSTGYRLTRRVRQVDVDALPPYVPQPLRAVDEVFVFHLRAKQVTVLSYGLTLAVVLDRLIGVEPETVRELQLMFGDPGAWTVWTPEEGAP